MLTFTRMDGQSHFVLHSSSGYYPTPSPFSSTSNSPFIAKYTPSKSRILFAFARYWVIFENWGPIQRHDFAHSIPIIDIEWMLML